MIDGPLYWRQSVMQLPAGDDYLDRLADSIVAVARAGGQQHGRPSIIWADNLPASVHWENVDSQRWRTRR